MPNKRANRSGATSDAAPKSAVLIPRSAATRRTRCSSIPIPGSRSDEHALKGVLQGGTRDSALLGAHPRAPPVHDNCSGSGKQPIVEGSRHGAALAARVRDTLAVQNGEHIL